MKKYLIPVIAVLSAVAIILVVMDYRKEFNNRYTDDNIKFQKEYESLNNKDNGYDGKHLEINVPKDNLMKYSNNQEIIELLQNGTGVIYFGFPECPWCRNLVPVLIDAMKYSGVQKIYYLNNKSDRDIKKLDENGQIIVEKESTEEYQKIVNLLGEHLGEYEGLNDPSIKRLYFPTVVFVNEGKIVGVHIGTLDSQTDPSIHLTDKQKEELKKILTTYADKIDKTCDKNC